MNNSILYSYIYEISFSYFDGSVSASPINCIAFKLKLSKKKLNYYVVEDMVTKFHFFFNFKMNKNDNSSGGLGWGLVEILI